MAYSYTINNAPENEMTEYKWFHVEFKADGYISDTKVRAETEELAARYVQVNYPNCKEVTAVMKG